MAADGSPERSGTGPWFGPYRAERLLGRGGMGQVYLAHDAAGRAAAVKVVHSFLARDREFRVRFRREVAAAGAVDSPRTAALLAADPDADLPWLASQYIEGPTLSTLLRVRGPWDEPHLRGLAAALAAALGAIHGAGLVHRDLKPSNVLIGADGPYVIDFGIARAADATRLTGTGAVLGSAGYAAPEQLTRGVGEAGGDVFALGAVLATAATGRRPFGAGPAHVAAHRTVHGEPDLAGVPQDLLPVIAACLEKDPDQRPALSAVRALDPHGEVSWAALSTVRDRSQEQGEDWHLAPPAPSPRDASPALAAAPRDTSPTSAPTRRDAPSVPGASAAPPPASAARRPAGRPPVPRGARRRRVVRAAGGAGLAVVVSAALACGVWWTWRGGDDRPPGDDVGRAGPPAPSSSPVTDPGAPGGDRELPAPSSRVRDVSLAAGAWTTTWDNLTPEPEAGEDVNAVRGSDLLGAWLTEDAVVRANEHDVRAYDRRTGRALWKATPPRHGLVPCAMSRTAEHGIGAVAFGRSHRPDEGCDQLAAIRLDDGQTVWRTGLRPEKREVDRVRTTVGIARGRVVVHSFSGLVAYDLGDGRAVWRRSWRHDGCGLSSVRAARAVVAVVSSCREGKKGSDEAARTRVSQLNADDGTVRWSTKLTEKATGASINTVRPLSVRLYLRDSDALPLQVFGPDGTAQPPLENEQPFGTLKTSAGLPSRPEIFGWKDTVVTTYYTRSDEARFGVAAIDTRTGKVRWHRPALDGVPELYGVDGDGALAVDERDGALGGTQLLRMDLSDGDVRTGGTLPTRDTGPVGTLLARKDTVLLFPSLDTAEGVAVLAAPGT